MVGAPSQNRSIVMPRCKASDDVGYKSTTKLIAGVSLVTGRVTDKCHQCPLCRDDWRQLRQDEANEPRF